MGRIVSVVSPADQLTVARALSVPVVIVLFAWPFHGHAYWATALFSVAMTTDWFDGRLARRHGRTSPLGSLLDPIADKVLVLGTLVMLVGQHVVPAWMVAAIVVREVLITGLRQAAIERGIVIAAVGVAVVGYGLVLLIFDLVRSHRHRRTTTAFALIVVTASAPLLTPTPASASSSQLLVSDDGARFVSDGAVRLFDQPDRIVPGGTLTSTLWIRNASPDPARAG